ncbi:MULTISPECIES: pseudouridine synthase [unclassified Lactobacillus]|uniref:pseudouridine synthase n=1 Tax=unclassified Lactobacillus TaxID=2620435 RepID=UPI000EFC9E42|nr:MULTISPECIES: pseudouridine synthase [unclassified Lactobacillus]RMC25164.1 rRNA pseudouridine synthase [Lactobacillus sp. ESL0247]RMC29318.1 rRNA pseudouridine synthase [Lactobacillus sp. ESL0246]RMC32339.1 rRNA pseudouridine synthase [Lactobacillus sp. ESL0245]RMC48755.1 rRNA pseudouridine synthase [Lactobacillus sp. ESL0228]
MVLQRLQKVIAEAGIASRRKAEIMIKEGRVTVDGKVITKLGTKVETFSNISVDGEPIERESLHTFLFYKPRGVVSTVSDDKGRKTVADYFSELPYRLYPVGRLDYDTSGLLLMTNDGELANLLMHPRNQVSKVYLAKINGQLLPEEIARLTHGVIFDHKKSAPAKVKIIRSDRKKNFQLVQLTIHEGHYHQVKKMFKAVNHQVKKLSREKYSFLTLDSLISGKYRELTHAEVDRLKRLD